MTSTRSILRLTSFIKPFGVNCQLLCDNYCKNCGLCQYSTNPEQKTNHRLKYVLGISGIFVGLGIYELCKEQQLLASEILRAGQKLDHLPSYSMKEVSEHSSKDRGIWVVYKSGVYDITEFIEKHPGGDKILMAAGGSVEPFWLIYGVHKQNHILSMLEEYRIGNLMEGDVAEESGDEHDPYRKEPRRHPSLKPSSERPFNAEPPPEILVESYLTPQEVFYVRNHLPVPEVELKSFELEISGTGIETKVFTLDELKELPKHTVTSAVQCAGNRRSEMSAVKAVKGLSWGHAAIGNATWTGVRLRDLLLHLGHEDLSTAKHVHFEGLDSDVSGTPYAASVPIEKALDPRGDVILAYEMNGEPLSRDHGFPLRAIVPGIVGARNVKWLARVVLSEEESDSHWQKNDYKGFSPSTDWDTVNWESSPAIQELPVTSAICSPVGGQQVTLNPDHTLTVRGYASSGGGRGIVRVDLTIDGGKTWQTAELSNEEPVKYSRNWAWTLWTAKLPVPPNTRTVEIWAKAVDSSYNTQPESFSNTWNLRGVLSNAYHRVKVSVANC